MLPMRAGTAARLKPLVEEIHSADAPDAQLRGRSGRVQSPNRTGSGERAAGGSRIDPLARSGAGNAAGAVKPRGPGRGAEGGADQDELDAADHAVTVGVEL